MWVEKWYFFREIVTGRRGNGDRNVGMGNSSQMGMENNSQELLEWEMFGVIFLCSYVGMGNSDRAQRGWVLRACFGPLAANVKSDPL